MGIMAGGPCLRRIEGKEGRELRPQDADEFGTCVGREKLLLYPRNIRWMCHVHELCLWPDIMGCVHPSTFDGKRRRAKKSRVLVEVPLDSAWVAHYSDIYFGEAWSAVQNASVDRQAAALVSELRTQVIALTNGE
jgi:hypothetical protein